MRLRVGLHGWWIFVLFQGDDILKHDMKKRKVFKKSKPADKEGTDFYAEMIFRLALVAEHKDETTGTHLVRMADYTTEIAHALKLPEKDIELLKYASPMHDIGKLVIPDEILRKTKGLTPEEKEVVKKHTMLGADIFQGSRSVLLKAARDICMTHHERYDGKGYPRGLKGEEIPLFGRIVALADVFDALTSKRPYKKAYGFETAVEMIKKQSGKQFDPKIVAAFLKVKDKIKGIWQATKDIEHFLDQGQA